MIGSRISSGGPWEDIIGYSRAAVVGPWILTSGCTSTVDGAVAHVGDAYGQATVAFGIALAALQQAGAGGEHVVRTRMYVTDIASFDEVGRAHHDLFDVARPATTMVVVSALAHPDHLVEVEVEAYLPGVREP
jgi:enamine deaminase RidA (YjgF/YER057c/UK114 family)